MVKRKERRWGIKMNKTTVKKGEWGRFIEHRPYLRKMSLKDWIALTDFVDHLLSEAIQQERERVRKWAERNTVRGEGFYFIKYGDLLTYLSDKTK